MDLKEAKHRKGLHRHPWELARLDVVCNLAAKRLEELNRNGGLLLDVGCGDTWFVEQLAERYPSLKVVAVDILFTDDDLQTLRAKYAGGRISVYRTMEEAQAAHEGQSAGMVLLLDVIEHIEDDIAFLKWLQGFSCITPDTCFMITVPAYQWLFSNHDVFLEHYRRYTNRMLLDHIGEAGLAPVKLGYFFFSLYLARILAWMKEKISGSKKQTTGLVEWTGGAMVTNGIRSTLIADFYMGKALRSLGIKIPGLSNYVLCKRSV